MRWTQQIFLMKQGILARCDSHSNKFFSKKKKKNKAAKSNTGLKRTLCTNVVKKKNSRKNQASVDVPTAPLPLYKPI